MLLDDCLVKRLRREAMDAMEASRRGFLGGGASRGTSFSMGKAATVFVSRWVREAAGKVGF